MTESTTRRAPVAWWPLALVAAAATEVAHEVAGTQSDWRPWAAAAALASFFLVACRAALALSCRRGSPGAMTLAKTLFPSLALAEVAVAAWTGQWGFAVMGLLLAFLTAGVLLSAVLDA